MSFLEQSQKQEDTFSHHFDFHVSFRDFLTNDGSSRLLELAQEMEEVSLMCDQIMPFAWPHTHIVWF